MCSGQAEAGQCWVPDRRGSDTSSLTRGVGSGAVVSSPKPSSHGPAPPALLFLHVILKGRLTAGKGASLSSAVLLSGANCLRRTLLGRTALHAAAAMGRLDSINLLLSYGASVNDKDTRGETPMSIARRMNRRHGERRMFLFYWMTKSGTTDPKKLMANKAFHRAKSGFGSKKKSQI